MEEYVYIIDGDPIPAARPRFANWRVYDAQHAMKHAYRRLFEYQHDLKPVWDEPLIIDVTFIFQIPKSRGRKLNPGDPHYQRPDYDNLLKHVKDSGNFALWRDDAIIYSVSGRKIWGIEPKTILKVWTYHDSIQKREE